jgi:P27 family predicted phage terminase small subunit
MGAGRPNKPTSLKVLQGTNRPDRTKNEPKPTKSTGVPEPPKHLDNIAKAEWTRLAKELWRLGLLTIADTAVFEAYCLSYGRLVAAQKALKKAKSLTYEYENKAGAKNIIVRPEINIIQKETIVIKALASEFGLSPSARARMEVPDFGGGGSPAPPSDPFEDFLDAKKRI